MKIILEQKDVEKAIKFWVKNDLKLDGTVTADIKTYPTTHIEILLDDSETPF